MGYEQHHNDEYRASVEAIAEWRKIRAARRQRRADRRSKVWATITGVFKR